jgi:hypothetical protein
MRGCAPLNPANVTALYRTDKMRGWRRTTPVLVCALRPQRDTLQAVGLCRILSKCQFGDSQGARQAPYSSADVIHVDMAVPLPYGEGLAVGHETAA